MTIHRSHHADTIWICPKCHGELLWQTNQLLCSSCRLRYPLENGIPRLLVNEASYQDVTTHFDSSTVQHGDDPTIFSPDMPSLLHWAVRRNYRLRQQSFEPVLDSLSGMVLDIGCGTGDFSSQIAHHNPDQVYGIDLSMEMLRLAQNKGIKVAQGSGTSLPVPNHVLDGALCLGVLPYLNDPENLLMEMQRVIAPDGKIFISSPISDGIRRVSSPLIHLLNALRGQESEVVTRYMLKDVLTLLSRTRFQLIQVHTVHFPLSFHAHVETARWWHKASMSEVMVEATPDSNSR